MKKHNMVNREYNLRKLAEGAEQNSSGEYPVVCPLCKKRHEEEGVEYNKKKLYISRDFETSYCFVCHTVFLDKDGEESEEKKEARSLYDLETLNLPDPEIVFTPMEYKITPHPTPESEKYLLNRSAYYNLEELINDGFEPDNGKVIINYLLDGKKYFYQIRYLHPRDGRKYFIPSTDFKPVYFAKGQFDPFLPTIITEGAFSSYCLKLVVPEFNVIAVQGSSMTARQILQLEQLGGIISPTYIFLDSTSLSYQMMTKLKYSKHFGCLKVIPNDFGKDPEELSGHFPDKDKYRNYILSHATVNPDDRAYSVYKRRSWNSRANRRLKNDRFGQSNFR